MHHDAQDALANEVDSGTEEGSQGEEVEGDGVEKEEEDKKED